MILYIVTFVVVIIFGAYSIFLDKRKLTCPDCEKCKCPECPPSRPPCPDCTLGAYPPMSKLRFKLGGQAQPKFPFAQPSDGTFYYKIIFNTYAQEGLLLCGYSWPQVDTSPNNVICALFLKAGKLNLFLSSGQNLVHQELSTVPVSNNKDQIVVLSANKVTSKIELRLNNEPLVTQPYRGLFDFRNLELTLGSMHFTSSIPEEVKKPFAGCIKQVVDFKGVIRTFADFYTVGGVKAGCSDAAPSE